MEYTNHSGGCPGADMEWESQGLEYGVKTNAYSFGNHVQESSNQCKLTAEELREGAEQAKKAALTLKRPWEYLENNPYVRNLISRNWFQVKNAQCVYAIGQFIKNSKKLVDGGTGWAVQMALDNGKSVYFFSQDDNRWYQFNYTFDVFVEVDGVPTLTQNFAGIGTRKITQYGKDAIKNVYQKTFSKQAEA